MSYPKHGQRSATAHALTTLFLVATLSGAIGFGSAIAARRPSVEAGNEMIANLGRLRLL